ncbi:cytochrome P450 [Plantactinospora sp. GCM10030261]|uniref:cytochrome P450 n=1 Tax=Plantactinospora sp. GCM10030261 TaxID=3273420 RepID=UPI00361C3612
MVESDPTPSAREPRLVPIRRLIPGRGRDLMDALVGVADDVGEEVVRLNFGALRPYLISHPDHVQHVLRDNQGNYIRGGDSLMWRALERLFGEGILSEGAPWAASRARLQPMFTAKRVESLVGGMSAALNEGADALAPGQQVEMAREVSRLVCLAINRVLFGDRIPIDDAMLIVQHQDVIARSVRWRILAPFIPDAVPMPGDRAFRNAVKAIDDLVLPVIRRVRENPDGRDDVLHNLATATDDQGRLLPERPVRDDVVATFATTTETTYVVLAWLWPILHHRPDIAERLYAEIDRVVVAGQPISYAQLGELTYTRQVVDELVRHYPSAWMVPRTAVRDDVLNGVRITAGSTMLMSPFVTQHMSAFWDRPQEFDPDRFAPDAPKRSHRWAYLPFGGGAHSCIGMYLFQLEAPLIIATLLSRFRFRPHAAEMPHRQLAASMRPREKIVMTVEAHRQPARS